jgi:hypothetical protein
MIGAHLYVFLLCLPAILFLRLAFGWSIWSIVWSVFFGKSLTSTLTRAMLFPLSFKLIASLIDQDVSFLSVLQDINKPLADELRCVPPVQLAKWLVVWLKRSIPFALIGVVVGLLTLVPKIGGMFLFLAQLIFLCRIIEPKLAALAMLGVLLTGGVGALCYKAFVGARSLAGDLTDYYALRVARGNGADLTQAMRQRRALVRRELALTIGFAAPFWTAMALVPGGAVVYCIAPGIGCLFVCLLYGELKSFLHCCCFFFSSFFFRLPLFFFRLCCIFGK